jgi:hypothetical protein
MMERKRPSAPLFDRNIISVFCEILSCEIQYLFVRPVFKADGWENERLRR